MDFCRIFICIASLAGVNGCTTYSGVDTDLEPLIVQINKDQLYFRGELNESSVNKALTMVKNYQGHIHKMTINSTGGEIQSGMRLGRWVFDHDIDLTVERFCMSSCANYIFTAAKSAHLNKNAILFWHGGATQKGLKPEDPDEEQLAYYQKSLRMEKAFFKHIGVKPVVTTYGQLNDFALLRTTPGCIKAHKLHQLNGWTYTIDDMKKFGIQHVTSDNVKPPVKWEGQLMSCVIPVAEPDARLRKQTGLSD